MKKDSPPGLSPYILNRLTRIFISQNWKIENDDEQVFNRCCAMLNHFEQPHQDMLVNLVDNFLRVTVSKYTSLIKDSFRKMEEDEIQKNQKLYILPLLAPKDFGKYKSSSTVWYLLKSKSIIEAIGILDNIDVHYSDCPEKFTLNSADNKLVVLVDDFIGSGETAIEAVEYMSETRKIPKTSIIVISLVAQEEGVEKVKSFGVKVYNSITRKKGISDKYIGTIKDNYVSMMQEIEDYLFVKDDFKFGWKASEALVKMIRTPNNTFPVFWHEPDMPNGEKYKTIFPR